MSYYFYKLISPRPSFPADITDEEMAAMGAHFEYWGELISRGDVIVYGPVSDPAATFGMAVVRAERADDVHAIGNADPAVTAGVCTFAVFDMPSTQLHPSPGASG